MAESYPYAKVTVIVELEGQPPSTYRITKARNLVQQENAIPIDPESRWPQEYVRGSVNLSFEMTADFDPELGRIYSIENPK